MSGEQVTPVSDPQIVGDTQNKMDGLYGTTYGIMYAAHSMSGPTTAVQYEFSAFGGPDADRKQFHEGVAKGHKRVESDKVLTNKVRFAIARKGAPAIAKAIWNELCGDDRTLAQLPVNWPYP